MEKESQGIADGATDLEFYINYPERHNTEPSGSIVGIVLAEGTAHGGHRSIYDHGCRGSDPIMYENSKDMYISPFCLLGWDPCLVR